MPTDDFQRPMGVTGPCPAEQYDIVSGTTAEAAKVIGDIFKDGAGPELTARMAISNLQEAIEPEPCQECGHLEGACKTEVIAVMHEMTEALRALPRGPFKTALCHHLRKLLIGRSLPAMSRTALLKEINNE